MSSKYSDVKLHINGKWRDAIAGETLDVINPATEDIIGNVAHARSSDLDEDLKIIFLFLKNFLILDKILFLYFKYSFLVK